MEKIVEDVVAIALDVEQDQRLINTLLSKYDREQLVDACTEWVDWAVVVNNYPQEVLLRVLESGTNFAFNRPIASMIRGHARRELARRLPEPPAGNGMQEDGTQG